MTEGNRGPTNNGSTVLAPVIGGTIAALIGIVMTWLVSQIWETPWSLGQAMIAVAIASFFASVGTAYGMAAQRMSR